MAENKRTTSADQVDAFAIISWWRPRSDMPCGDKLSPILVSRLVRETLAA